MMREFWKVIRSFPLYEGSTFGRVRNKSNDIIKKQTHSSCYNGDLVIAIYSGNETHVVKVASLIAQTFLGACPKGHKLVYLDKNAKNCYVDNLSYVTREEFNDTYRKNRVRKREHVQQSYYGEKIRPSCDTSYKSVKDFKSELPGGCRHENCEFDMDKALREVLAL
jgi:hypothetical protein